MVSYNTMDSSEASALFFVGDGWPAPFITPTDENPFLYFVKEIDSDVSSQAHMDQAAAQWRELFPDSEMKDILMFMSGVLAMYYWMEFRLGEETTLMLSPIDVLEASEEDAMRLCSQAWEVLKRGISVNKD